MFIISHDYSEASSNASVDIPLYSSCNFILENDPACIINSGHESINREIDSKLENQSHINNFDFPLINNGTINAEIIFIKDRTNCLLFCSSFEASGKSVITDSNLLANENICLFILKFSKMCFTANSLLTKGLENIQHYLYIIKNIDHVECQEMNNDVYLIHLSK